MAVMTTSKEEEIYFCFARLAHPHTYEMNVHPSTSIVSCSNFPEAFKKLHETRWVLSVSPT